MIVRRRKHRQVIKVRCELLNFSTQSKLICFFHIFFFAAFSGSHKQMMGGNGGGSVMPVLSADLVMGGGVIKKREDLTSLGSDDSGIICNSENEPNALSVLIAGAKIEIGDSHESINSNVDDMMEMGEGDEDDDEEDEDEEDYCENRKNLYLTHSSSSDIDIPTTVAMAALSSTSEDCKVNNSKQSSSSYSVTSNNHNNNPLSCKDFKIKNVLKSSLIGLNHNSGGSNRKGIQHSNTMPTPSIINETSSHDHENSSLSVQGIVPLQGSRSSEAIVVSSPTPSNHKNEVMFRNFFGATKNAIFRTAQSIIENHEKKNANKKGGDVVNSDSITDDSPTTPNATTPVAGAPPHPPVTPITETTTTVTQPKKRDFFTLKPKMSVFHHLAVPGSKSSSDSKGKEIKVPGNVHCMVKEEEVEVKPAKSSKSDLGHNGLLRFFESPIFNIHFAVHYLFYSKEPGVLSFIGNKVFSFTDQEVDLYIPQLILMYIQMDELAEILDSYLVYRCRKSVDFSLKCAWLLEAYNCNIDLLKPSNNNNNNGISNKMSRLFLLKELYPKRERKYHNQYSMDQSFNAPEVQSPVKKTHHRSQSDATGLLSGDTKSVPKIGSNFPRPLTLGDLSTGRAFDNGCVCFETVRGAMNDLRGQKTVCCCGAPKLLPEREFMKTLIEIGRTLTTLPTKSEKTTSLRMFLNLVNKNLPARVWLPLHSEVPHHVVRITEDKTAVLNSKDKTPYIIYVEVVEVSDIYTCPVMPKLMPTLRHTKSEEHLESALQVPKPGSAPVNQLKPTHKHTSTSRLAIPNGQEVTEEGDALEVGSAEKVATVNRSNSECFLSQHDLIIKEDDVWSQEDDEITAQYLQLHKLTDRDAISQMSMDSCDSKDHGKRQFSYFISE